ncbi:MAG: hypothetical protein CM15mP64_2830 [Candidatus Neomarinimicrobiota bacterium]|nr:MAG: hypothetical protein CM15mP64_2830 [Candidatus Neomarinimicrobiota bacterium]
MKTIIRNTITFIVTIGSIALAQGITLPSEPSQAPIGGLGWLAALGGALAYKNQEKAGAKVTASCQICTNGPLFFVGYNRFMICICCQMVDLTSF